MPAKVKVSGQEETAKAFDKLADDIANMPEAHAKIARARIPGVASRTPVLSGELRGSWDVQGAPDGASILSPLPYSVHQEFGTKYIAPVRMIAETFEAEAQQIETEYNDALREAARRRGFRTDG